MTTCSRCTKEAVIYMRDLKHKGKPTVSLCEEHFRSFCHSLIENEIKYEQPTPDKAVEEGAVGKPQRKTKKTVDGKKPD